MSLIRPHDIYLYGGAKDIEIVLRPVSDADIPLLCRLNSDPEVLALADSNAPSPYTEQTVIDIWGKVSQNAHCFIVEADGEPIGECWLQKMNMPEIIAKYPEGTDIRRIDMSIGVKEYWDRGIGTAFVGMLIDYAFFGEFADVVHCFCDFDNARSNKVWQKSGFTLRYADEKNQENHYAITRAEYINKRRVIIPREKQFMMDVSELSPSQLYISDGKLRLCRE